MAMTIDRVRNAVRTDPVRRLVGSAPSADEVRAAISERLDGLGETIGEGLGTLGESLGTVAERVDPIVEEVRGRVTLPDQLAALPQQLGLRPAPPPRLSRPAVAILGAAAGLAIGFIVARMDRQAWMTLRDRGMKLLDRLLDRAGARGRDVANRAQGAVAVGLRSVTPQPVGDDVLAERARSALGRARGLHAIKIEADDGVVRVSGQVDPGEREDALAVLRSVPGVRDVEDHLEDATGSTSGGSGSTSGAGEAGASGASYGSDSTYGGSNSAYGEAASTSGDRSWASDADRETQTADDLARVPDTGTDGYGEGRMSGQISSGTGTQGRS